MAKAFIGIGSNLGNREEQCKYAIHLIKESGISVRKRSTLIETEPWGVTGQPRFLNMVIEIETGLTPGELIIRLKDIERTVGRKNTVPWGPRVIDLDILLYDDCVISSPDLKIPHPRMSEREFVLRPLAEIAPDTVHPVLKKSIKTLLKEVASSQ